MDMDNTELVAITNSIERYSDLNFKVIFYIFD